MPMTPWHVGPGMAMKAVAGRRMSLGVFCVAQVLMDVEVVVRLLTRTPPVHGYSTTLVGAVAIGAVAAAVSVPPIRGVQRLWQKIGWRDVEGDERWLPWRAAWFGALAGTISHVVIDSVMHPDVRPFWPISDWSPIYKVVNNSVLHDLCFWSGAIGAVAMLGLWLYRAAGLSRGISRLSRRRA